jgi:hypothetical protein
MHLSSIAVPAWVRRVRLVWSPLICRWAIPVAAAFLLHPSQGHAASAGPLYSVGASVFDSGGGQSQSDSYTAESSLVDFGARAAVGNMIARAGFTGQLNDPPLPSDLDVPLPTSSPANVVLIATDAENDALQYRVIVQPTHGTLSGTAPTLVYTPGPGTAAIDQFTFVVNDGLTDSAVALVTLRSGSAAIVLHSPVQLSPNELRIDLQGQANACYRLLVSLDLVTWTPLLNAAASPTGLVSFSDRTIGSFRAKFYRVVGIPCTP